MPAWHSSSGTDGPEAGLCVSRTGLARARFFLRFMRDRSDSSPDGVSVSEKDWIEQVR